MVLKASLLQSWSCVDWQFISELFSETRTSLCGMLQIAVDFVETPLSLQPSSHPVLSLKGGPFSPQAPQAAGQPALPLICSAVLEKGWFLHKSRSNALRLSLKHSSGALGLAGSETLDWGAAQPPVDYHHSHGICCVHEPLSSLLRRCWVLQASHSEG